MNQPQSLLSQQLTDEERGRLLEAAAHELHTFLEEHPQATAHFLEILGRRLGNGVTVDTWGVLGSSVSAYLGRDPGDLIAWVVQSDQINKLQLVEEHASPKVVAFLRTIVGLYGVELETAFALSGELPHNWRTIFREVYYDKILGRYRLQVRIEKMNGESTILEGPPDSLLSLTSYLILTLNLLGDADAFSEDNKQLFLEQAEELIQTLRPKRRSRRRPSAEGDGA